MEKTLIIAEAGVNHNGDVALAKQLVDVAVAAGADYVKFQTFKAEHLVSRAAPMAEYQQRELGQAGGTQYDMLKKLELDLDTHRVLIDYCQGKGIRFLSTPFDHESVDLLAGLGIGLFKIPSGEITNRPYLEKVASKNKPVILSTGMATLGEIEAALGVLYGAGLAKSLLTVLHCNTEYPTPMADVNLRAMAAIGEAFKLKVGYSDHTLGIEVPVAAVAMGATVIEKHFTLDKTMAGPDHKASLEPAELKAMVAAIRNIETALGHGVKQPSPSESKNKVAARKSLHALGPISAGQAITRDMLAARRPGDGLSPMRIDDLVGLKARKDIAAGQKIKHSDVDYEA